MLLADSPPQPGRTNLAPLTVGRSDLVALAMRAEKLGFGSFWLSNQFLMSFGEEAQVGFYECRTFLRAD